MKELLSLWTKIKKSKFLIFGVLPFFVIKLVFSQYPSLTDSIYLNGIFKVVRFVSSLINGVPISIFWMFVITTIYFFFKLGKKGEKVWRSLAKFVIVIYMLFYVLWGFNYSGTDIVDRYPSLFAQIELEELKKEYNNITIQSNQLSKGLEGRTRNLDSLQKIIKPKLESALAEFGFDAMKGIQIKYLYPRGILLRWSTSGFYFPYALEGYIDPGLHDLQIPFTLAHEMTHAYGLTNEAECNFIAYLACMKLDDDFVRYSAKIAYWKYLRSYVRGESFEREKMSEGFKSDILSIRDRMDLYPDLLPNIRNWTYDQFLKANGVNEGIRSYSRFVRLNINYEKGLEN